MRTTKLITILLLTIFLVSCQGPQILPKVGTNLSFKFNRCRLFCYDLMRAKSVNPELCNKEYKENQEFPGFYEISYDENDDEYLEFIPGNYPIEYCDETLGFYISDYAIDIKPWANKTIKYYEKR